MNTAGVIDVIESISSTPESGLEDTLQYLGQIIAQTNDPSILADLAQSNQLREVLEIYLTDEVDSAQSEIQIRIIRGVLLLVRNLTSKSPDFDFSCVVESLLTFSRTASKDTDFFVKTLTAYFQTLANMSQTKNYSLSPEKVQEVLSIGNFVGDSRYPFILTLNNLFNNSSFLYNLLNSSHADEIVMQIIKECKTIKFSEALSSADIQLISCICSVITHESFNKWLSKVKSDDFVEVVQISRIIITAKESWDNYQLTAMLSWVFHAFQTLSANAKSLLPASDLKNGQLDLLNLKLSLVLDILSDLCKFNQAKEFLLQYNAIEDISQLLITVHENIKPVNMTKQKNTQGKSFPNVKSSLIEIVAYLSHQSFDIQEKVREFGALAVILSSCIIDDNNPFMKERAIVCLKLLLDQNKANQDFVASLEAKTSVDDEVLKEVGYEVEVQDGKVKLKKS